MHSTLFIVSLADNSQHITPMLHHNWFFQKEKRKRYESISSTMSSEIGNFHLFLPSDSEDLKFLNLEQHNFFELGSKKGVV
jgi:hypothetical protein